MIFTFTDEQEAELRLWQTDLRETEFPQASHALRKNDGFCCLGIYLFGRDDDEEHWTSPDKEDGCYSYLIDYEEDNFIEVDSQLPDIDAERLGLDQRFYAKDKKRDNPRWSSSLFHLQTIFIAMNDDLGLSFREIADEIDHLIEHGNFSNKVLDKLVYDVRPLDEGR